MQSLDMRGERLRIRHFVHSDLDACVSLRRDAMGLATPRRAVADWLRWTIDSYRELAGLGQPPYADYAVTRLADDAFIGAVGIVPTLIPWGALRGDTADKRVSPEVGLFWAVLPQYRRRGYASEAGRALLDFLFETLRLRQVVATTEKDNIASQKTMARLGMKLLRNPAPEPSWCQVVGVISRSGDAMARPHKLGFGCGRAI